MRLNIYLLLCILFSSFCFCQTITLKGVVKDNDDIPLESATVYLTSVKDSSVVDYTISGKNGSWELKTRKITEPVFLKVSFISYNDYKQQLPSVAEDRDFGIIKLTESTNELDQVVIEAEVPPVRIKQDTIEFNAASFKTRPDANVEALLLKLPGVVKDADGKITYNGKDISKVLVNGSAFFDSNGQIALQNLPAELINKVQITDTKTKKEELSGQKASGDTATINLTIDDDKNKGFFGKIMGGYGSDERYESSLLINYFKNKKRLSILGSSNNINAIGFSMNEVFDNMGGGRNINTFMNSAGATWTGTGLGFGGTGITISNMIGLTYADEWSKKAKGSGSYFFSQSTSENQNRSRQVTLLPQTTVTQDEDLPANNGFTTESSSNSKSDNFSHNFNAEFEFKIDSTSTINIRPKFLFNNSVSQSTSQQITYDENNETLNESTGNYYNDNDNSTFSNEIDYHKGFKDKDRFLTASFNQNNNKSNGLNLNRSTTIFHEDPDENGINELRYDVRDQITLDRETSDNYTAEIEYTEPVHDSLQLRLGSLFSLSKDIDDSKGYDYDAVTGDYTALNQRLTNYLESETNTINPKIGFNLTKKKYNLSGDFGTAISTFDIFSVYLGSEYALTKKYMLPTAGMNMRYRPSKTSSLFANYRYSTNFPGPQQVLPVTDISNPLYTISGNPDLDPNQSHSLFINYHNFKVAAKSGFGLNASATLYDSQIVNYTIINESAKRTTTYRNLSGAYRLGLGGNWNKSFRKNEHNLRLALNLNTNYNFNRGFTNGQLYESKSIGVTPGINVGYDYGELISISPSYNFSYNENNYTNYTLREASNYVHRFNLQITSYWPKHVVFGNDFGYTYNSNIADEFKKDFYLWNTSIGYNFLDDNMLFKVKVYDVLNQNIGTSRTITPTTITDQENTVLRRYIMFSLTFKLKKFGGKDSNQDNRRIRMW